MSTHNGQTPDDSSDVTKQERIDHLEEQLAAERRERQALEARVDAHRRRMNAILEAVAGERAVELGIEDGFVDALQEDTLVAELRRIERGEIDTTILGTGETDDLPIQRMRADVKSGRHDLDAQHRRATEVWARFIEEADPSQGTYTLTSAKVKAILDEAGEVSHPEARKRAMQALAGSSDGLIDVVKDDNRLVLRADRDELVDVLKAQQQTVEQGANQ